MILPTGSTGHTATAAGSDVTSRVLVLLLASINPGNFNIIVHNI